mgnify:CR=1 FL=1
MATSKEHFHTETLHPFAKWVCRFIELQLLPCTILLSPFSFIALQNVNDVVFSNETFFVLGVAYLVLNIILSVTERYRHEFTLRVCLFISVTIILFNIVKNMMVTEMNKQIRSVNSWR